MIDKSEQIKNYAICGVCVAAIIFFISYAFYLNKKIEMQNSMNKLIIYTVDEIYNDYKRLLESNIDSKNRLIEKSELTAEVINEISMVISARILEEQGAIRRAEADMMVVDSIHKINSINPRIAKIISLINKTIIKNRR
jgi:hypothetical protein